MNESVSRRGGRSKNDISMIKEYYTRRMVFRPWQRSSVIEALYVSCAFDICWLICPKYVHSLKMFHCMRLLMKLKCLLHKNGMLQGNVHTVTLS